MADLRDDRVSRAYQDLPDDGPAPAIDAAIQAAARRAVGARPGAPRRWQIPLSIAAVLTLAVGLSLQVEHAQREADKEVAIPAARYEAPAPSSAAPSSAAPSSAAPSSAAPSSAAPSPAAPAAGAAADSAAAPARESPERATTTTKSAAEPRAKSLTLPAAPAAERSVTSGLVQEAGKPTRPEADGLQTPERQLEHIAELRAKGRHEEAERELAAFRRAFPDYRISAQWRRKVERPGP